jgi:hypothetical protein
MERAVAASRLVLARPIHDASIARLAQRARASTET